MADFANTNQLIRQLSSILSIEKLPVGFFVGAGCPVSIRVPIVVNEGDEVGTGPLIPDVAGLTSIVKTELAGVEEVKDSFAKVMKSIEEDGKNDPNIEVILGFVRTLAAAAGNGEARGLTKEQLAGIDRRICESISEKVSKKLPESENAYQNLASFIEPRRSCATEIFTTNYDLLMEQALERAGVPYFDGFVGSHEPFFDLVAIDQDLLPSRWARLWKLHGSINWRKNQETKRVCRTMSPDSGVELLIHPSHHKYDDSRRMPYFALIDKLKAFLRNDGRPVALFLHGFSFSDEHLNAVLEEGMRANPQAACFAIQYAALDSYPDAVKLANRCPNLTVYARDAEYSKGQRKTWMISPSPQNVSLKDIFSWDQDELEKTGGDVVAALELGDFKKFGSFLKSLSGIEPEMDKTK